MFKKPALLMAVISVICLGMVLACPGCKKDQAKCETDEDCDIGYYCANDGKCHEIVKPDGSDGEADGGEPDGDPGPGDADEEPPPCTHDRDCPPDKICDVDTGECVDGTACQADYNCPDKTTHYCDPVGGICKLRSLLCEPCEEDYQCPDPGLGDMCIDYPDGGFCGMSCGRRTCPAGYDCDEASGSGEGVNPGQCRSNTNSCEGTFVCHGDEDCPANQVCDLVSGNCRPMCTSDTICPAGHKCHFTGHCGPPCASDIDCAIYGDDLVCCITPGVPVSYCGQGSTGLCRPTGCALHSECLSTTEGTLGYCDKSSGECVDGCRWGQDQMSESDCRAGNMCDCVAGTETCDTADCCMDPGGACLCDPTIEECSQVSVCDHGQCVKIPCQQREDVAFCARNQLCCGWPADGYPCASGVPEGDCYMADANSWCAPCSDQGPCDTPGMGYGEPGVCMPDSEDENNYCHPACRDTQDCPSTWECDYSFGQGCETNDDCEPGAICDVAYIAEDGTVYNACHCTNDSHCPADFQGFTMFCDTQMICDNTQTPPDCHQGMICLGGKACQCPNCCSALHGG